MGVDHGGSELDGEPGVPSDEGEERQDAERANYEATGGVGHFTGPHFVGEIENEDVGIASVETYWAPDSVPLGVSVTTADGETGAGTLVDLNPNQAERLGRSLIEQADAVREDANEDRQGPS